MPLSELLRLAEGKSESGEQKPCPPPILSRADDGLVELVWENGQIVVQSQSNRAHDDIPSNTNRFLDAGVGDASTTRIGKLGVQSIFDDMSPVVPSGDLDLSQDDDHGMVPWLRNHPPLDYSYELLPEISGVTANGTSAQNSSILSADKKSMGGQTDNNLNRSGDYPKASSSRAHLCSWSSQCRPISEALRSGVSDIISRNNVTDNLGAVSGNSGQCREIINDSTSMKTGKQTAGITNTDNSNLLNFYNFSRPASLVKSSIRTSDEIPASVSPSMERVEMKEKNPVACASKPVDSKLCGRSNNIPKDVDFHASCSQLSMSNRRQPVVREPKESCSPERPQNIQRERSSRNEKFLISTNTANSATGVPEGQRNIESAAASSSVGSGNSTDRVSCEKTHSSKRKFCDIEESECHSDDVETESVDLEKPTPARGVTGSKRSRAAEVHNLSERRRRDRINEKMRALQELIPNCNKVDKASMLDEAIEYLKTLQLQVQIMSMGAGSCIPPMMFPTGMQQMHPAHVPHFSAMGVGIGMGMGARYGMGMLDMNSRIPGCPIFPIPPMHVAHLPPVSGPNNFQRISAPCLPAYGHPGQGLYGSVTGAPSVPLPGQPPIISAMDMSGLKNESPNKVSCTNPITDTDSQLMFHAKPMCSIDKSNQMQATNEVLNQPSVVKENKYSIDAAPPTAHTSTTTTGFKEPSF